MEHPKLNKKQKEMLSDASFAMQQTLRTIRRKCFDAKESVQRAVHGYAPGDLCELGDVYISRLADICGYLSECSYDEVDLDWFEKLRETENVLRAASVYDEIAWRLPGEGLGKQLAVEEAYYGRSFLEAWKWCGQNLFSPRSYHSPKQEEIEGALHGVAYALANGASKLRGGISYEDIRDLPCTESRMFSRMLTDYAEGCYGSPCDYENSAHQLKERDEAWAGRSINCEVRGIMCRNGSWSLRELDAKERIKGSALTNSEAGASLAAWLEDVNEAASIIDMYATWNAPADRSGAAKAKGNKGKRHFLTNREYYFLLAPDEAEEIDREVDEAFTRAWEWIGWNIRGLWN